MINIDEQVDNDDNIEYCALRYLCDDAQLIHAHAYYSKNRLQTTKIFKFEDTSIVTVLSLLNDAYF